MVKKIVTIMLVPIMLASVFAGCAQSPSGSQPGTSAAQGATEFDWKKFSGSSIKVAFVQHSTADSVVSKIADFTAKTGIDVDYSITPEANYFDKINTSLASGSGDPDVFMSGAYQLWDYSTAGYVEDLSKYLNDPTMMTPDYDFQDLVQSAVNALKWDGIPGDAVGTGKQLGLPLCFEIYSLAYNKKAFDKLGLQPPKTYDELLDVCTKLQNWNGPGSYPLAIRGARDWGTIHPGYMSTFATFGAKDFTIQDNKLVSGLGSPEAVNMTQYWVDLIKTGGAPSWSSYTWYECGADLGAGKAAMLFDADNNGIQQDWDGASAEAGNLAWAPMPVVKEGDTAYSNYWTWSIAMNSASKNKGAAWYFIEYFTTKEFSRYASVEKNSMDPIRTSTWNDKGFQDKMAKHPGYIDTFNKTIDHTSILFTPQPHFFETTTEWAATLQDIVAGKYASVDEGMKALADKVNNMVSDIDLSQYK